MACLTKVAIQEDRKDLDQRLQSAQNQKITERLQILYLLALPQALTISAIANVIGRHRGTLQRLRSTAKNQGLNAFLEIKASEGSRSNMIPAWAVESLKRLNPQTQCFASYIEVQTLLRETLGIEAEDRTVYELVRYRLKAKLKAWHVQFMLSSSNNT